MITIIPVKSRNENQVDKDGVFYIENSEGRTSMAEKYNWAIENIILKQNDPVICFRHEDTEIRTPEDIVEYKIENLMNSGCGIVGLIGTIALDRVCTWWNGVLNAGGRPANGAGAIIQGGTNEKGEPIEYWMKDHPGTHDYLATVDGCCFWLNRKLIEDGLRFDETLKDYHFYDVDISLQVLERGYKVSTVDIAVKHSSQGVPPKNFNELRDVFFKKWDAKVKGQWPISRLSKFF